MRITIKKWGNSASIRIPATIMDAAHLALNEVVDVREEAGRVIIERVHKHTFKLEQLLANITKENLHDESDFGPAMGMETY